MTTSDWLDEQDKEKRLCMALKLVFECPWSLKKLRNDPLGKLLDGFCNWLLEHGFVRIKRSRHQEDGGLAVPECTWQAAELCAVNWEKMKTICERRSFTSHNSGLHITLSPVASDP